MNEFHTGNEIKPNTSSEIKQQPREWLDIPSKSDEKSEKISPWLDIPSKKNSEDVLKEKSNPWLDIPSKEKPNIEKTDVAKTSEVNENKNFELDKTRHDKTPVNDGEWSGDRGNSNWNPDDNYVPGKNNPDGKTWKDIKEKYNIDSIPFENDEPDFSELSKGEVEIDDYTDDRDKFDPDKRVESKNELYDSYSNCPLDGKRGGWEGERGDSIYIPDEDYTGGPPTGKETLEALEAKGKDGIEYKNGEPDFSDVAEGNVEIKNMGEERYGLGGNFEQADQALADKWNSENHNGRNDWTARDIQAYRSENRLTWHERQDCKTMDLVDSTIHRYFTHLGGVGVINAKNRSEVKFDE